MTTVTAEGGGREGDSSWSPAIEGWEPENSHTIFVWTAIMSAAFALYMHTPVSFVWAAIVQFLAFAYWHACNKRAAASLRQDVPKVPLIGTAVSVLANVSYPLWLTQGGDLAVFAAAFIFLGAIAVMISSTASKDKIGQVTALSIAGGALLIAPILGRISDPGDDWSAYILLELVAALFVCQIFHANHFARRTRWTVAEYINETRRQETLSRMLFDQSSMIICLLDEDLRYVRVNDCFKRYLPGENVIGRRVADVVDSSCVKAIEEVLLAALTGKTVRQEEIEMVSGKGEVKYFGIEASPWRDLDGSIVGVISVSWDTTESVKAKHEVTRGIECLDIALDASNSVVLEHDLITNEFRWFGDPVSVYGRSFSQEGLRNQVKNQRWNTPEADIPIVEEGARVARCEGKSEIVHRVYMPDGELAWMQVCMKATHNADGKLINMIYKSTNITQSKRQEAELLEALRRAGDSLKSKRSLLADLAHESGLDAGLELKEFCSADSEATGRGINGVAELVSRFNALLSEVAARDEALGRAVQSLRKARETSEAANVAKSQFLANMSHELRTPLNAIIGYSEILCEDARDDGRDSDVKDHERVLVAAKSLLILINEILDLSKIEAGRMDISIGDFDVPNLIAEAVATVKIQSEKNGNVINISIDPELQTGRSDAFKLNQCLLNLLSNAAKFTKNGTIDVRADLVREGARDWLQVSVADTGIGMTEEQASRLFQPFMQADTSTTREYGGTGLGLVITRRIVQLMGGDVSLHSVKGVGSNFTMRVPLNLDAIEDDATDESLEIMGAAQGPVALIIDDEADSAELVLRSIGRLGFRVLAAPTAAAGLRAVELRNPSVILLDINLPDRSGWSVLEQLTASPETKDIPVIVHSIHDDKQRALSLGACAHFVKPTDRDVLAAAVARFARVDLPAQESEFPEPEHGTVTALPSRQAS